MVCSAWMYGPRYTASFVIFVEIIDAVVFFFQAEDGIRDLTVTGVQTCALPISWRPRPTSRAPTGSRTRVPGRPSRSTAGSSSTRPTASCATARRERGTGPSPPADRKSVGEGKRGELGGRRVL